MSDLREYKCPACGGKFTGTRIADYCYHCGQKLDWSLYEWATIVTNT